MKKSLVLSFFVLTMTACSLGSFLIGKLDYYITKKSSSRLGLYVSQEEKLRVDVQKLLDSIKPEVAVFLGIIKQIEQNPNKVHELIDDKKIDSVNENYLIIVKKVFTTLSYYLADLSDKQVNAFLKTVSEQIEKKEKKAKKGKQFEKYIEKLEEFLGPLTAEQKIIIRKQKEALFDFEKMRIAQQKKQYQALIESLSMPKDQKLIKIQDIFKLSAENISETMSSPAYKRIAAATVAVLSSLTKKQQTHLQDKCEFFTDLLQSFIDNQYYEP